MILDFEKARSGVLDVLRGKINTPTAVRVVQALKDASVEIALQGAEEKTRESDCGPSCARYPTCEYNHGRHGVVRINCPLWRPKK